jgi:hypothetical protein
MVSVSPTRAQKMIAQSEEAKFHSDLLPSIPYPSFSIVSIVYLNKATIPFPKSQHKS